MGVPTDQLNAIMQAVTEGESIESLPFPITDEVRTAFKRAKAELARAPGGVMYWPIFDPGEWHYDELIANNKKYYGENYANLLDGTYEKEQARKAAEQAAAKAAAAEKRRQRARERRARAKAQAAAAAAAAETGEASRNAE
jgi:hypothetical protein